MENRYPAEIERLMESKGFMKQRGEGVSIDALSGAAGVHVDTVKSILRGSRASRPSKVKAVAEALGVSSSRLLELAGRPDGEVYVGPDVTRSMTERQRAALTDFLLATLDERKAVGHDVRDTSNTEAGGTPAEEDELERRRSQRGVTRKHTPPWERQETAASEGPEDETPREETGIEDP